VSAWRASAARTRVISLDRREGARPGRRVDVVMWSAVAGEFPSIPCMEPLTEFAGRSKGQAPPPWVIWEAICDPGSRSSREWFDLRTRELVPDILESRKPDLVVWSSIWEDRPEDSILDREQRAGLRRYLDASRSGATERRGGQASQISDRPADKRPTS
jgi:hypothetical protein